MVGDVMKRLAEIPDESIHCVATSPPYFGLRDYGVKGQIGLEDSLEEYIAKMVKVFREVRRTLRKDGTFFLNVGDSYWNHSPVRKAGKDAFEKKYTGGLISRGAKERRRANGHLTLKMKDKILVPHRLAIALQDDGWWVRQDNVWRKPNPIPEPVKDRPVTAHEYVFLLTKAARYFYDIDATRQPYASKTMTHRGGGRAAGKESSQDASGKVASGNMATWRKSRAVTSFGAPLRSVWDLPTRGYKEAHFATFPEQLPEICVKAGTSAAGACASCGSPWKRDVAVTYDNPGNRQTNGPRSLANRKITAGFSSRKERRASTVGWSPTCECNANVVPCAVLDPFSGAGTTALVAMRLRRSSIGIELNPEYVEMSVKRLAEAGFRATTT